MKSTNSPDSRDSLLEALAAITRLHHQPHSAESLVAGLPLKNGLLTPSLFARAAASAGFKASYISRKLTEITPLVLPVVLEMKSGQMCILLELHKDIATVLVFEEQEEIKEITVTLLHEQYNGNCYLVKPGLLQDETSKNWFWNTIRKSRNLYAEVLVASALVNLFALVTPLFIMNVYDRVVPNHAIETLWVLSSGVAIVFIFDLVMKSLRGYFIDAANKRSDVLLSSQTFGRVMDIKIHNRPSRVGSFANNLQEFDSFRDFFTSTTLVALIDLPFLAFFLALIYLIGGGLVLVPLIAIPVIILAGLSLQKPLQKIIMNTFKESAAKHALLVEVLASLDTVKGARAEGVMQKKWETFSAKLAKMGLRSRFFSMTIINLTLFLQQISTVAIVILGVYSIIEGQLSVGGLIACTILTGRCLAPMSQVAGILTRYHHSIAAFNAIDKVMDLPVERPINKKFLHRPKISGEIEFKEVNFSYKDQQIPAISNLSFKIKDGEKVAIVGQTGSGKTTLQKLVMSFYEPATGAILVSGTDINQIDPSDLRRNISYVPQQISLFDATIRENIVLGTPLASDEKVLAASRTAGILGFVNTHPQGFDMRVGERGERLSGGQRQGIAIARAIINHAPIILLDEPTASFDSTTEVRFLENFVDYAKERTLLLVTHKASMLSLVDRLIVLDAGKVVADGPKDEILRTLSGNSQ